MIPHQHAEEQELNDIDLDRTQDTMIVGIEIKVDLQPQGLGRSTSDCAALTHLVKLDAFG